MREILFRGKTKGTCAWIEGYYFKANNRRWDGSRQTEDWIAVTAVPNGGHCDIPVMYAVIPETVGQFTGKPNKSGVKIFEGDILESWDTFAGAQRFVAAWDDSAAAWTMQWEEGRRTRSIHLEPLLNEMKLIGNIHDNPELMHEAQ